MKPLLLLLTTSVLFLTGCPKDKNARDTAAALKGLITTLQTQYQSTCQKDSQQTACVAINRGIDAQNGLVTATELYCGFATSGPAPDPNASCKADASEKPGLDAALAKAKASVTELKGLQKP